MVHGAADEGYGPVADAFRANFAERNEIGAAVAVYRDGRKVVDLWGGHRDGVTKAPWEEDTLVTMFSTTKGVASMAVAVAHSRGLLDYDAPVAGYWPEFSAAGKERVTVRQLLSHQAGLCAIDERLDLDDLARPRPRRRGDRGAEAGVGAGHAPRLPRDHARLVRGRADPARRPAGPHARALLRGRGRRAARARLLHRPPGRRRRRSGSPASTATRRPRCCCTCTSSRPASCSASSTRAASPTARSATRASPAC